MSKFYVTLFAILDWNGRLPLTHTMFQKIFKINVDRIKKKKNFQLTKIKDVLFCRFKKKGQKPNVRELSVFAADFFWD